MLNEGHLHKRKYLCKKLEVKEGWRHLFKGDLFSGTYKIRLSTKATLLIFSKSVTGTSTM